MTTCSKSAVSVSVKRRIHTAGQGPLLNLCYILIRNEIFDALEYATLRRNRESVTDPADLPGGTFDESRSGAFDLNRALNAAQSEAAGVIKKGIVAIRLLAEGYTNREIGERMGATANNVTAWVSRARKYLRSRPEIAGMGKPV